MGILGARQFLGACWKWSERCAAGVFEELRLHAAACAGDAALTWALSAPWQGQTQALKLSSASDVWWRKRSLKQQCLSNMKCLWEVAV